MTLEKQKQENAGKYNYNCFFLAVDNKKIVKKYTNNNNNKKKSYYYYYYLQYKKTIYQRYIVYK